MRGKTGKSTNMQELNITLLNNKWVKEEITREIEKYLETNKHTIPEFIGYSKGGVYGWKFRVINTSTEKKEAILQAIT